MRGGSGNGEEQAGSQAGGAEKAPDANWQQGWKTHIHILQKMKKAAAADAGPRYWYSRHLSECGISTSPLAGIKMNGMQIHLHC
jgi:hypothetical protein